MSRSLSEIPKREKYMDLKDIQVSRRDTGVDELAAEVGNSGGVQGDK